LQPVFINGQLVYEEKRSLKQIREDTARELAKFSPEIRRLSNPHIYHVDLSQQLWDLKQALIHVNRLI
jgi:nicotinate phosphoribosyltransferase